MVAKGDLAPDFDLTSSGGARIVLSSYRGKKNVVLFFYPGDFTPVCTKEACGFRDLYSDLTSKDTEVIGVSTDDDASHRKFAAEYGLGFPLLADPDKKLAKTYGATSFLTAVIGRVSRVTYVIDKTGHVAAVLKGELSAKAHTEGVVATLATLGT